MSSHNSDALKKKTPSWYTQLKSPLWLFLLVAALLRVYLVVHTHGVIEGDEGLVGIQAQHILNGERPIYFYRQPYLGTLGAYLTAGLFMLAGSSVWTLRAEPILLTLGIIWLTWRLAYALANHASFSFYNRKIFMYIATIIAVIPPLYDAVYEVHSLEGYVETYLVMLLLLLSAVYLVDRWQAGASNTEIALRWAGIGWLIGLGLWIDPLVISAIAATATWIVYAILKPWKHYTPKLEVEWPMNSVGRLLYSGGLKLWQRLIQLLLMLAAIPGLLIGNAPAIYWGRYHGWQNIAYMVQRGPYSLWYLYARDMLSFYTSCLAPRVIGGAMPIESTMASLLSPFMLSIVLLCIGVTTAICVASYIIHSPFLLQMRRVAALPLLFAIFTVVFVCTSSKGIIGMSTPCASDIIGRYASPIMLAIPFFFATTISFIATWLDHKRDEISSYQEGDTYAKNDARHRANHQSVSLLWSIRALHNGVLFLLLLYITAQIYTYHLSDPGYTFQSPYCQIAPANNDLIIAYMERKHIHYAWATNIVANVITFKTQGKIIAVDPLGTIDNNALINRLPAYTEKVQHADRPSMLQFVATSNPHPRMLHILDQEHISYTVARFPSEPGIDIIVVTPLNRTAPVVSAPEFRPLFLCQVT